MLKKITLVLVIAAVAVGGVFAQDKSPKSTITVDFGPTIIGAAIGAVGDMISDDEDGISSSGFGIAAQYEYQLMDKVTLGGRFAYLGGGLGISSTDSDDGLDLATSLELNLSSWSLEAHARYYPAAKTFFVDGMLGYASLSAGFSGTAVVTDDYGHKEQEAISFTATRGYLKFGAKIGWRIDFGKPGGFIFEPSFGYYGGMGLGDTLGKQLANKVDGEIEDLSDIDDVFSIVENFIFVGGPRFSLSFGWRF